MEKQGRSALRTGKRGKNCSFIGVWVPESIALAVDDAAHTLDLSRSEFLRRALGEKILKEGK